MKRNKSLSTNAILGAIKSLTNIIFPLITYPYITRILRVDDIGRINFAQSIVSYFSLLAGLGISTFAIRSGAKIRDSRLELEKFCNQVFSINIFTTLLSCALLLFIVFIPSRISEYRVIILILGLSVLISPFAIEWYYVIQEDFIYITIRSITVQVLSLIMMFAFVHNDNDVYAYVTITVLANSLANVFNFAHARKQIHLKLTKYTNWHDYKYSILTFFGNSIASTIYLNSDTTLLGLFATDYNVGLYSVATKIYFVIKQVFNAVIATMIPRLSYFESKDQEGFLVLVKKIIETAFFLVLPAITGIVVLRKEIIMIISGDQYIEAEITLTILAGAILFAVIANILANGILVSIGKEKKVLKTTLISSLENIVLNLFMIPLFKQNGAALTTVLAELTVCILAYYYTSTYLKDVANFSLIKKPLCGSIVMGVIITTTHHYLLNWNILIRTILIITEGFVVYFLFEFLLQDKTLMVILQRFNSILAKKRIVAKSEDL